MQLGLSLGAMDLVCAGQAPLTARRLYSPKLRHYVQLTSKLSTIAIGSASALFVTWETIRTVYTSPLPITFDVETSVVVRVSSSTGYSMRDCPSTPTISYFVPLVTPTASALRINR